MEEGEELLADGGVADEDGEEPERDVEVLLDAVEAERLRLRDLVEDVLHQVADDPQRVLDHGHRLRLQREIRMTVFALPRILSVSSPSGPGSG